jgi:capsular polysaccharide biosynthesis protein
VGPLDAFVRHPFMTLIPMLLVVGAAVAIGLARLPTYTAEARVNVGRINVPAFTLQGVIQGNQTLAASYSRAITAPTVVNAASRATKISPQEATARLSASPVAESTLIRVEATGHAQARAVALANAASRALIRYVAVLNQTSGTEQLLARYGQADRVANLAQRRLNRANRIYAHQKNNRTRNAVVQATVAFDKAKLFATQLAGVYSSSLSEAPGSNLLQLETPAVSASSDASSVLTILILIGAAAGLVLGLALSLLRANRPLLAASRQ